MEKEALIDIILSDLNEIQTLVGTFKGKKEIQPAFINLTKAKIQNINEELNLLEQLFRVKETLEKNETLLTTETQPVTTQKDEEEIAVSANRFMEGEANDIVVSEKASEPIQEPIIEQPKVKVEIPPVLPKEEVKKEELVQIEKVVQEVVTEEIVEKQTESIAAKPSVLGEQIKKEATSVNEQMGQHKEELIDFKQIGKPVDDIRKAIGLNDRFYFQRELFNGNADQFNQTLDKINTMDSFNSALNYLKSTYQWEADNEASESFLKSVKRRFI